MRGLQAAHGAGERVVEAFEHLEQRQVRVGDGLPCEVASAPGMGRQQPLEIAQVLRQAQGPEVFGPPQRLGLLLLIVEALRDRMVRVVRLDYEIRESELEL